MIPQNYTTRPVFIIPRLVIKVPPSSKVLFNISNVKVIEKPSTGSGGSLQPQAQVFTKLISDSEKKNAY